MGISRYSRAIRDRPQVALPRNPSREPDMSNRKADLGRWDMAVYHIRKQRDLLLRDDKRRLT